MNVGAESSRTLADVGVWPWVSNTILMGFFDFITNSDLTVNLGSSMRIVFIPTRIASQDSGAGEGVAVTSERHRAALCEASVRLLGAAWAYERREPAECVAQHLRGAQDSLGTITGEVTDDELLDRIFSRFCIGK